MVYLHTGHLIIYHWTIFYKKISFQKIGNDFLSFEHLHYYFMAYMAIRWKLLNQSIGAKLPGICIGTGRNYRKDRNYKMEVFIVFYRYVPDWRKSISNRSIQ